MSASSSRLWEKGTAIDERVHRFTVGDDPTWDRHLVHWDCVGSAAHARTLARAQVLDQADLDALLAALSQIDALAREGRFEIPAELEDCHTAIEAFLAKTCGKAGERIHTGRSRNDQIAVTMRLFMRHRALRMLDSLASFATEMLSRGRADGRIAMPGYTHMQPAMPSSVGQWLHAIVEAILEQMQAVLDLLTRLDACPLGTGAGFGVPLPLDRGYTASLLGFSSVQRSPIDVQNSRGRKERYFVRVASDVGSVIEKMSCDLLLFSSAEYGFFSLPNAMRTGSSIMPQKMNPDVLELLRGRSARLRSRLTELEWVSAKLPSSYHRDLQLTKEPTLRAAFEVEDDIEIAAQVIRAFTIDVDRLSAAMRPELYATQAALQRVQEGMPFRQAYRQVASEIVDGRFDAQGVDPKSNDAAIVSEKVWTQIEDEQAAIVAQAETIRHRVSECESALLPPPAHSTTTL